MPSDTPTPALTREQVEARIAQIESYPYPQIVDSTRKWELRQLLATMTERDTLRSEVEGLKALCGELVGEEGMRDEH